jgi:hypothetical protein
VPVEHGVDSADRGNADIARQAPDQQLPDLAGAPVRLVFLGLDNRLLDLAGDLRPNWSRI